MTAPLVKPLNNVAGGAVMSQRDTRIAFTVYDQHRSPRFPKGRPWWGYIETPANKGKLLMQPSFVGRLMPGDHQDPHGSNWHAPWYPPSAMQFFKVDYYAHKLRINYDAMLRVFTNGYRNHYKAAVKIASERGWPAPALGEPISYQISQVIGPCPPHPRIVEAAMAGDPWILGFSDDVNEELQRLLVLADQQPDTLEAIPLPSTPMNVQPVAGAVSADLIQSLVDRAVEQRIAAMQLPTASVKKPMSEKQLAALAKAREAKRSVAEANASPGA